jgi:hypothetical protein
MNPPEFTAEIFQNEYLPDGAREVNAIVTVTATGSAPGVPQTGAGSPKARRRGSRQPDNGKVPG